MNWRLRPRPRESVVRIGWKPRRHRDLYHWFLTLPLPAVAGLCVGGYVAINLVFAGLYLLESDGIANARPGNAVDAFFFSVQTVATIGYGNMYPKSLFANLTVTVETVTGLLYFALITGLLFTRFSRPHARVLFSKVMVVTPFEGVPTLMFRIANERRAQILQARIKVTLLRSERSAEGIAMWRQRDLNLVRDQSSFFGLSWTVMHRIDRDSPLSGETDESLTACEAEFAVLMAGVDEALSQTVFARHNYTSADIRWNHRFADILLPAEGDQTVIDLSRFHDVEKAAGVI